MRVELVDVHKRFGDFKAADGVSFGLREGSLAALLGPSGGGKTTVLRLIAGLETPDAGDIKLDGVRVNDAPPSRRGLGFVFQNYALFRYMTVFDNIAFGLMTLKESPGKIKARVRELMEMTGLSGLEKRYPAQLSGGQKQRTAFARALAPRPRLLLLDEPFAAVDAQARSDLRLGLKEMIKNLRVTSLFVTHDQAEAVEMADEIIVINRGRVERMGAPVEIYRDPATPFVARFIGESTLIEGYGVLKGFEAAGPGGRCAVRPEFIKIYRADEKTPHEHSLEEAEVAGLTFKGDALRVLLRLKGLTLAADYPLERGGLAAGERVRVLIRRVCAFDGETAALKDNALLKNPSDDYAI